MNGKFQVTDPEEKERLILARYREAVEVGIKLLDTHFEKVQLPPSSDSDDEDTSQGFVFKIFNIHSYCF